MMFVKFIVKISILAFLIHLNVIKSDDFFNPVMITSRDEVVKALFPQTCASGEHWLNETSARKQLKCIFQLGHFDKELNQFAADAESIGCKVDHKMIKYMADTFGKDSYADSPIYQRLGSSDCGFCGHKTSCCGINNAVTMAQKFSNAYKELKGIDPFYFESIRSVPCSEKSHFACSVKPLTSAEFDKLASTQPYTKNIDRSDGCNMAQFGFPEWESCRANPSFPLVEPLYDKFLCRTVKTNRPKFNCVKNPSTNQCMCCCNSNYPESVGGTWICRDKKDKKSESVCDTI